MRISDWSSDVCSSDLRYFELGETGFIPPSAHLANQAITIAALVVFAAQMLFFWNMIWSLFRGPKADPNPWGAASLEWQTPDTPPKHGNWGEKLPVVHRWAYDYSDRKSTRLNSSH